MLVVFLIDLVVVVTLLRAGRRGLEDALPLFCFYLVLLPLESRFVIPGLFDLGSDRVAMLTLLGLFLTRKARGNTGPVPMKNLMYMHIAWAVLSTIFSISVATSAKQLVGQVIEYYLLYYMLFRLISDVSTIYRILYAMSLAMGLCSVFGLFEAYKLWSILYIFPSNLWIMYGGPGPLYIEWGRGLRLRSTFPHPILFGDALAMIIPITLYLLTVIRQKTKRLVLWGMLPLMVWAIYKTSSRGPWLALGMSFPFLFLMLPNKMKKYLAILGLAMACVLATRSGIRDTISNIYESTQDAASPVGASYEYRNALLHAITSAVAKDSTRMLLGYGLGTFREKGLIVDFLGESKLWFTCDDNWACFIYETGYVGLVLVGLLLLVPLLINTRSYLRLPRPERYLSGVLFISLAAFCFLLLSVAGYNWGQQGFMAWILISLSVVYPRVVMRTQKKKSLSGVRLQTALPLAEPAGYPVQIQAY